MGLSNPSCTSTTCQWMPNNKVVEPVKIEDLKLSKGDFGRRGKDTGELNCSSKKKYNPITGADYTVTFEGVIEAMRTVMEEDESIISTAVPKQTVLQACKSKKRSDRLFSFTDQLEQSSSREEYLAKVEQYFPNKVKDSQLATKGQSDNTVWFPFRQHLISASKACNVKTRWRHSRNQKVLQMRLLLYRQFLRRLQQWQQ